MTHSQAPWIFSLPYSYWSVVCNFAPYRLRTSSLVWLGFVGLCGGGEDGGGEGWGVDGGDVRVWEIGDVGRKGGGRKGEEEIGPCGGGGFI